MSNRKDRHNMSYSRIYSIWGHMRNRCVNKKYNKSHIYFEKGIQCCEEWNEFKVFYSWAMANGYTDILTIDRIDGNKNYCPENCRWATVQQQNDNKSDNVLLTYKGQTKNITQWAAELGVNRNLLYKRKDKGLSDEDILTRSYKKKYNTVSRNLWKDLNNFERNVQLKSITT